MNVERKKAEPVTPPPDTIDITGLTLREAGALRALLCEGISWHRQESDLDGFFRALGSKLPFDARISLDFADLHDGSF